ncbi:MAG TPA: monofunctional biosynthetic peptidoglycan transglycosylase [Paludibacteraceae bacterium]|nr:monofunctional biosynthetic peptidoglycan transglycosylase [Paludibacteraceae bacterium]HQB69426.1 monofunctional biosynthetic peptidoglycan transglycosylase [Paludibacteraceae bacterium]HRS67885.1 monofunctional biosynthetic peptidoglycan transglycosylase [Paludibacteraceae bacterium]
MKKLFWKVPVWFFGITFAWVVLLKFLPVYVTPLMVIRVVEAIFDKERDVRVEKTWIPIEKMSPKVVRATIAGEDDLFLSHYGFSIKGIRKAYEDNKKGKRLKGGSTISQQTAKNVFTSGSRTWVRKGFEAYFTVLIELVWGKERIMEVYLNVVELGDGIYGVEAASQRYFNKSAAKLNASQSALLVASLPSPRRYSVTNPGPYMRRRQEQILWMMRMLPAIEWNNN